MDCHWNCDLTRDSCDLLLKAAYLPIALYIVYTLQLSVPNYYTFPAGVLHMIDSHGDRELERDIAVTSFT